ncbi:tetrahydromethanopterin S-methyltransferase subunit MtrC [Methanosphaera sp.]
MADDLIPSQIIILVSVILGTISIYLSSISIIGGIFSIIATVLAVVMGTNTLRHIGKYSLGTGIPSIIYMLTACSLVSVIAGLFISLILNQTILFPILSLIIAVIVSLIISLICKVIFKIQVEILPRSFMLIALAATLSIVAMSTLIVSTSDTIAIYNHVIKNGLIILLMIITVMAIQNPYNSCMGPNEDQYRTLSLSMSNAFLMLIVISIISLLNNAYWYIYLIIAFLGWLITIRQYFKYTKQQAASVRWSGLWPNSDEGDL